MNRRKHDRKGIQGKCVCRMRGLLAWMLCVVLVLGNLCVPEYTGMSVQAAGTEEVSVQAEELTEMSTENSIEEYALSEDDIASGTYENITWRIDAEGKLTVEGTGEFSASEGQQRAPWYSQRKSIKTAVVRVTGMKNASHIFFDCSYLTSVDVSGFDTSSVTDMSGMFYNCRYLTSLDVSGFDTSSVTDMNSMFGSCVSLQSLDVSRFKTDNVTDMNSMFSSCISLQSLDVSSFKTSNVTDMSEMFTGCRGLTSLDVSGFDTSNVTGMTIMFNGCKSLTSLDVSGFDMSNVKYMSGMFENCSSITQIKTFRNLQIQEVALPKKMQDDAGNIYECFPVGLSESITLYATEKITWWIDAEGKLTVEGTGEFSASEGYYRAPWASQSESIKTAVVRVTGMKNASYIFFQCYNLTSVDVSGFDTSSVTDMSGMFRGCTNLTSLDLSGFDTSNVTDMSGMFMNCSSLQSIDVSRFKTSNVTDIGSMFSGCSSLTNLDVSGFDTSSVTDMSGMFHFCTNLTSLDVSGLDTSSVINMNGMFRSCSSLENLDVSGLDTSSVINMNGMFRSCSSLENLDVSGFDTSSVTDMGQMFMDCRSLTSLDMSGLDTSSVINMNGMFEQCSSLENLDLSGFNTSNVEYMSEMFMDCNSLTSLDVSGFNTSNVSDMSEMFKNCSSITQIKTFRNLQIQEVALPEKMHDDAGNVYECFPVGLPESITLYAPEKIKWRIDAEGKLTVEGTGEFSAGTGSGRAPWYDRRESIKSAVVRVTGMENASYMFCDCNELMSVDLSGFDTSSVTDMGHMFENCRNLTSLDLSGFDTSKVTDMDGMFYGCDNLTSLDVSSFDTSNVTNMEYMFSSSGYSSESALTSLDVSGFNTSKVTNMSYMFSGCRNLTSLNVRGFDTSKVTNMRSMFFGCENLTSLDVSGFDTSNVTDMNSMFSSHQYSNSGNALTSLNVSGFNTSKVTDMSYMFYGCENLTSLDVSGFDTSNVTNMSGMFSSSGYYVKTALKSLDVSGFNTSKVTDMSSMFFGCENLTSLDVSGFDTSNVTNMYRMFSSSQDPYSGNGNALTSLDVSGFDTSNVTSMGEMFYGCDNLTSLDVSGFDTSSVRDMGGMFSSSFRESNKLTSLDVSGFDTSNVADMGGMFYGCENLTSLDVSGFDTSNVTDMSRMFTRCSGLTSLDVSGFDTSKVTDMSNVFGELYGGCSGLTSLDVSGFDTSNVTDMSEMFCYCESLTSLDVSGFDTSNVTNMSGMFKCCSGLTSLDVSGFDTSNVTDMSNMFGNEYYGCSSLTSLDVSGFDTSSVTNMSGMFAHCSGLTSLDVSGFDTSSVTSMGWLGYMDFAAGMFTDCRGLTSLDVSGFDTSSVTNMGGMFKGCHNLTSLDVSGFDTSRVTDMRQMFAYCRGLTSLDVSGFDTSNVTNMGVAVNGGYGVFEGCMSLTSLDLSSFDMSKVTYIGRTFVFCDSLTTLYTPYNVDLSQDFLPGSEEKDDVWYDAAGNPYTLLPTGLDHSILLMKNTKPDAAMTSRLTVYLSKSAYELDSVVKSEDLTVKYRGTDGKTVTLPCQSDGSNGYTMSAVDMSTPGVKTLTISYNDGSNTLTGSVTFTVFTRLTDDMVTLPEGEYVYNGKMHKPVPVVKTADGVTLTYGKDYSVSYTNNFNAGEAGLSVTGRNAYGGTVTKNFTIRKATLENVKISFSEFCGKEQNRTRNLYECFRETAEEAWARDYRIGEVVEYNDIAGGEGNVLAGTPSIGNTGNLVYRTNAGTAGDTALIPVTATFYGDNYNDALILVTVRLSDKTEVSISGISMKKKNVYNGSPVTPKGTAKVRADDEAGTDVTEQVTLSYRYTGTQSDGTAYDSDTAPTRPGSYILSVTVAENALYEGSAEYPFVIGKAPLTITATDRKLVIGTFDDLPDERDLIYKITGLLGTHTAQDVLSTQPSVYYGLNGMKIDKASIAVDKEGSYELIPSGAVLNQAFSEEYEITERSYRKGRLTIIESSSEDPTNPDDPTEPNDPVLPDDGTFRVSDVPDQIYTGSAIKPAVRVYYGSRRLTEKTDYTISYKNNVKANDTSVEKTAPTITVTGKGNYSGKQTVTFVIKPKSIEGEAVTAADLFAAQSGKAQKPVPVLTWKGKKLKAGTDFTVSYPDENTPGAYQTAGTYAVTVTGTGNYTGTKSLNFTITDKTLLSKAKVTVKAKDYAVGGVTLTAEDITVKVGKDTLVYGKDYTLSYRNNTQAGRATVIVTGTGDTYAGSKEATFQIKGESLAKAQISGIVDQTYTGAAQSQNIQVKLNDKILQIGDDYKVSYAKSVNAGTATVTVTGKGGYTGTVKKSFKITAYDLQTNEGGKLEGIPQKLTTAYTKGGATPALTLTFDGKPLVAKKDYTITYKNNKKPASMSDAKAPAMVIKGKGNFKGTLTVPFAITVSDLETEGNVTIMAPDTAYVDKAGKYMTKPVLTDANGKKLTAGTDYEKTFTYALVNADGTEKALTAADIVPEGSEVKVTVTGKGNYTGTLSATYRIAKTSFAKAKITITPQAYTGGAVTLDTKDIKVELNGNTLIYGTDYTIVPGSYRNNTKKGTATVTVKGLGDYGGMKTAKFKITAKILASFLKLLE